IAFHALEQGHAVEHGHHAIEDHQIVWLVRTFQCCPGGFAVGGGVERVSGFLAQVFLDDREVQWFVVDDQDAGLAHELSSTSRGSPDRQSGSAMGSVYMLVSSPGSFDPYQGVI